MTSLHYLSNANFIRSLSRWTFYRYSWL